MALTAGRQLRGARGSILAEATIYQGHTTVTLPIYYTLQFKAAILSSLSTFGTTAHGETMSPLTEAGDVLRDAAHLAADQEVSRGRKRSRSTSRAATSKSLRPDESSTLRGRSPRRATSPFPLPSRNTSPSILRSPTSQILLYNQLRRARREHCPSRTASPSDRSFRRRQRTRSRSRSRSRGSRRDHEPVRSPDILSSLRHEVFYEHADGTDNKAQP